MCIYAVHKVRAICANYVSEREKKIFRHTQKLKREFIALGEMLRSFGGKFTLGLARGVRTRSKFKINHKKQDKTEDFEDFEGEIHKKIKHIESRVNSTGDETPKTVRRSKFSNNKANNDDLRSILGYKDPSEIRSELLERFKKDGVDPDSEFIDKMVEESQKEMQVLKKYMEDPKSIKEELSMDEINHFIEWLISDGQKRILMDNSNTNQLDDELNEMIKSDDQSPESLVKAFDLVSELGQDEENSLKRLPQFLYRMTRLRNSDLSSKVPAEKWGLLYGISTSIKNDQIRNQCIYLCGKLLYSSLVREYGPKMRPDPINEKFYIESLIKYEQYPKALELFNSRKEKDVKEERFWFELGAEIYISMGNMDRGIEIIDQIKDKWGYINSLVLVKGLKVSISNQNVDDALWFWEEVQMNIDNVGLVIDNYIPETQMMDDSKVVFDYYNRVEPVSWQILNEVIFAFIGNMRFQESFNILNYVHSIDSEYLIYFIQSLKSSFDSLGLQLFVNELKDSKLDDISASVKNTLMDGLVSITSTENSQSIDETLLMNNILVYLNRLAETNKRDLATINDLREMIKNSAMLTTFDANSLLDLLLQSRSNVGSKLATELLNFMNKNVLSNNEKSSLPKANSNLYNVFCKYLLSYDRPKLKGLDGVLKIMEQSNIPMEESLASNIISKLILNKQYGKAISFIERYVMTDDSSISVKFIDTTKGEKSLWNTCLLAYYQLVFIGKSNIDERNKSLRDFIYKIVANEVKDESVFSDTVGVLLAFNDIPTCIAFIKWYGETFGSVLLPKIIIGIKGKLEERLLKLDDRLGEDQKVYVDQYKERYGLAQTIRSRAQSQDVTNVIDAIKNYCALFGYVPNSFTISMSNSDIKVEESKREFERLVELRLREFGC